MRPPTNRVTFYTAEPGAGLDSQTVGGAPDANFFTVPRTARSVYANAVVEPLAVSSIKTYACATPPNAAIVGHCTRHPLARWCEDGLRHSQNLEAKMRATSRRWIYCGLLTSLVLLAFLTSSAQTYSVIHNINCTADGCGDQQPIPLTQGRDGNLYGQIDRKSVV